MKRFRSLVYAICFVCGMDCFTKDGCFFVCIFISVFIIFILKRINNQNVNHLHSFQQTDSQIDLHIIQTALNACEKQSDVRNQKKKQQQQGHGIQKQKQSKSTIHFIKSPEIVFELISNSQRMFKRYFNENYLNYSAPTSFMSFPFYANICCAMRWNVGAACFFFYVHTKPNQEGKKENQRENELGSTKRDPQNTNITQTYTYTCMAPYASAHKTRIWLKGLHGDNDNDIVDTKQQAAT